MLAGNTMLFLEIKIFVVMSIRKWKLNTSLVLSITIQLSGLRGDKYLLSPLSGLDLLTYEYSV
jgi:hypothetical protein